MVKERNSMLHTAKANYEAMFEVSEDEKQRLLQSMIDELDHINGLPRLQREVETDHLIPRKITSHELKRDIFVPVVIAVTMSSFFMNFPAVLALL